MNLTLVLLAALSLAVSPAGPDAQGAATASSYSRGVEIAAASKSTAKSRKAPPKKASAKKASAKKAAPAAEPVAETVNAEPVAAPAPAAAPAVEAPAEVARSRSKRPLRVAVLNPQAEGIEERLLGAFVAAMVPEVRKLERTSAIGMNEIRDMLEFDRQRQLMGCTDTSCLAEIAGALGVDELVTTQLSLVGKDYILSMRRIRLSDASIAHAETRQFERRDGEELLMVVGPVVESLFPDRPLKPGRVRGVEEAAIRRLNPPPLPRWAPLATLGVAAVALAGGATFGLQSRNAEQLYNEGAQRSLTEPVSGSFLKGLEEDATGSASRANLLFAVGGGLVLTAAIEALFTDWRGDGDVPQIAPMVMPEGGGVAVGGEF